jgi:hypothetical protein
MINVSSKLLVGFNNVSRKKRFYESDLSMPEIQSCVAVWLCCRKICKKAHKTRHHHFPFLVLSCLPFLLTIFE